MGLFPIVVVNSVRADSREDVQNILFDSFEKIEEYSKAHPECENFQITLQVHAWIGGKPELTK